MIGLEKTNLHILEIKYVSTCIEVWYIKNLDVNSLSRALALLNNDQII